MENNICPLCGVEYDENYVCAIDCMALVTFEDDQERAAAAEAMQQPLTKEDREDIALTLFRVRLKLAARGIRL